MILTKKHYQKDKAIMYGAIGASGTIGVVGTTLGAVAIAKVNRLKNEVDTIHTDMERRMSAEEGMTKQFGRAISQIQTVLESNNMLRVKS